MRHYSVVSRYAIPIRIPQVDGWLPGVGLHSLVSELRYMNT